MFFSFGNFQTLSREIAKLAASELDQKDPKNVLYSYHDPKEIKP